MVWTALGILIVLLALAVPVAAGLGFLGIALSEIYSRLPLTLAIGEVAWATSNNFLLVAIPFFVLLGEILLRSGMAERMYNALVLWVPWLPGGLMHSNIAACAMFAATSGSSVATAATIGTVAMGEIKKHGYSERLFLGTIAAGGTLGILIPPSINMIVYGVLAALGVAAWHRRLSLRMLLQAFEGTMRTNAMIMAILIAAYFLNFVISSIGLTAQVNRLVTGMGLTSTELLLAVIVFYLVLGCFMETLSMMVATVPIIAPIMFKAGYDPIWFGILIVILMETAMITPPVGINLYVVQGLRKRGRIDDVIIGAAPFVVAMLVMIAILSYWPNLALWLPRAASD